MTNLRVYLTNYKDTIKLTRDDDDNIGVYVIAKGEKYYTWIGYSDNDLADTITDYMRQGYKLKSIY